MQTFQIFNIIIPDQTIRFPIRKKSPNWAPIFVVGCPRSGTSLVGECIAGFAEAESVGESLFIRYLWRLIADLHLGINPKTTIVPFAGQEFSPMMVDSIGNLCDNLFESLRKQKTPFLVDHTPWNGACIPLLYSLYPNCKFVHVVRNPIAVSKSLMQSALNGREWAQKDPIFHANFWCRMVQRIDDDIEALSLESIKVSYEDVCLHPTEAFKKIATQFGLTWNEEVLLKTKTLYASNLKSREQEQQYLATRLQEINRTLEKWPSNIQESTREIFSSLTSSLAARNGYVVEVGK